nr:acylneuraminate cytidylyltransferase family protein [uncultured Desulfobulbus sp.]
MKILALILARGGSKRLPGKNIRSLGGKPLVVWSIDIVKDAPEICDILVSTDNSDIASISSNAGAYVPWLRPKRLATDTASSIDATLHALDWYESQRSEVDGILLLQPTSPFRTKETVRRGLEKFRTNGQQPVIGVSPTHAHPLWALKVEGNHLEPYIKHHGLTVRSQELPLAYKVNGSFYLISPKDFRRHRSFFIESKTSPLVIQSQKESLDIDTEFDFNLAQFILNENNIKNL